ncbi:hypothetical protein BDZ97DRAFT_2060558 [Flammula alnicola]|nr:hypothetical protein BDZ97DRAFT_2060558 [Flammula alnicola]
MASTVPLTHLIQINMRFSTAVFATLLLATGSLAAAVRNPDYYRREEYTEYTSLTRRAVPMNCPSHNDSVMCNSTHECLSASGRPTRRRGAHPTLNAWCESTCSCRQPLGMLPYERQEERRLENRPVYWRHGSPVPHLLNFNTEPSNSDKIQVRNAICKAQEELDKLQPSGNGLTSTCIDLGTIEGLYNLLQVFSNLPSPLQVPFQHRGLHTH